MTRALRSTSAARWAFAAFAAFAAASCAASTEPATVLLGGKEFAVEVADSAAERQRGLAGRAAVPPGTGMLFSYGSAAPRSFWMAGMEVPIDLAWIRDGAVLDVITLQPCEDRSDCPAFASPGPVDAVVEVGARQLEGVVAGDEAVLPDR